MPIVMDSTSKLLLIAREQLGQLPFHQVAVVAGGHDVNGSPLVELDRWKRGNRKV